MITEETLNKTETETEASDAAKARVTALLGSRTVSDVRRGHLAIAADLGASDKILEVLISAVRVSTKRSIWLPQGRYAHCSRGRDWCRKGRGTSAVWGERVDDGGFRVGEGRWTVGSNDGFSRKDAVVWAVKNILIAPDVVWTIAN